MANRVLTKREVAQIERALDEPCGKEESQARDAGRVLLVSAIVGGSAKKVADALGWPLDRADQFTERLTASGVWVGGKVAADWFDPEDGGIAFALDVNVALGFLQRTGGRRRKPRSAKVSAIT